MKTILKLSAITLLLILFVPNSAVAGKIFLRSGTLDTKSTVQTSMAQGKAALGAGYYIVALKGHVKAEDKQTLIDAGAQIIEYVPDNALIVKIEHSKVDELKKLSSVDWVSRFKSDYKIGKRASKKSTTNDYLITLFPGQNADYLVNKGNLIGIKQINCKKGLNGAHICRVIAKDSQIKEIASLEGVSWIEPYSQSKLSNNVAAAISGIPSVRQDLGLYGAGQIVGAADAGLDSGNLSTISSDFAGRIDKTYSLRRQDEWSDLNGHGTHVIGSLLGAGILSGSNPGAHSYDNSFAGYAPEAHLIFQSIGDQGEFVFPPLHLSELFQPAYDDGVRVHSNSWGSAVKGEYTIYSSEVDQFVWDHKDFAVVFAVGNEAEDLNQDGIIDRDNLCAPATAKNCISVGTSESDRSTGGCQSGYGVKWGESYPTAPIYNDFMSNNPFGIVAFSGRGPTDDGRIKPDICAPGTNIISCRSQSSGTKSTWGIYDSHYVYMGGTSMSTPQVAGAAVLTREYFQKEKGVNPSAALIKATLLNGATDMAPGQYGTGSKQELSAIPDMSQGWGRLDLKQSLDPVLPTVNEFTDEPAGLATDEFRDFQYSVIDTSVPFKATLVWSDYPGSVHAALELVNDLDLMVISPTGRTYIPGIVPDHKNNVEQVKILTPEIGIYTIRVTGYNVPMGPQDYALAVSGGLPTTYISGKVTSISGAAVQGAMISFVSSSGIKRVTTDIGGKYVTHVASGRYSLQIGKPGWTFTPRSAVIQVNSSPVTEINFTGQGTPGSISGNIMRTIGGVVSRIVESPHPYMGNCDKTYEITAHDEATRIRVHFAEIELMDSGDKIMVLDSNDSVVYTYTSKGEDIYSPWVNGRTIKIHIISNDYNNMGYGFFIDGYETDLINQGGLTGANVVLNPGNYQGTTTTSGQYMLSSIPPGTYTVTPSRAHWKFQPASKTVEIPSGGSASDINFLAFPPGSINGNVYITDSTVNNTNVESEHPYVENTLQMWQINGDANVIRIRLHFSYISTEPGFDFVHIKKGNDDYVESYTSEYTNLWTPWIQGNVARIVLESDEMGNYDGFQCDKYEVQYLNGQLSGVQMSLSPDGRTTTTSSQGTYNLVDVDTGSHVVTAALNPWSFDPAFTNINVAPGLDEQLTFYASIGEINITGLTKLVNDGVKVTLKNQIVSAVFNGYFYVEDSLRSGGLRIVSSTNVTEGNVVDVTGTMSTSAGERLINATTVIKH